MAVIWVRAGLNQAFNTLHNLLHSRAHELAGLRAQRLEPGLDRECQVSGYPLSSTEPNFEFFLLAATSRAQQRRAQPELTPEPSETGSGGG